MTRRDRTGEAGFLLTEMLAALTISAFVLAGTVLVGSVLLRAADRGVAAVQATDDLGRTLASLDGLIGSAVRARFDGAQEQPYLLNGDDRRLMLAHRDTTAGQGGVTRVVALRSDGERLLRADAALPARVGDPAELVFGPPRVVYAGRAQIRFAYAGPPGAGLQPASLWPIGQAMPSAVVVEAVDRATGRVLARSRTVVVADADPGCVVDGACGQASRQPPGSGPEMTPAGHTRP